MKDDLISRKAAIEVIRGILNTSVGFTCALEEMIAMVETVPSVPAVPLDKLCEWIGGHGMLAPCYFDQKCDNCKLRPYWRQKKSECWRHVLTEWMEEYKNDAE